MERQPARPVERAALPADVANRLPAGNEMALGVTDVGEVGVSDMAVIGMPRGAAGIDTLAWLAALLAALGGICIAMASRLDAAAPVRARRAGDAPRS